MALNLAVTSDHVPLLPSISWHGTQASHSEVLLHPEALNSEVANKKDQRVEREDENWEEVEGIVNRKVEMKTIEIVILSKTISSKTKPEMMVVFAIHIAANSKTKNQRENDRCHEILKNLSLSSILHPVTLTDINIAVGNNSNWDEPVQEVDKEIETYTERAYFWGATFTEHSTHNQDTRNISNT